MNKASPNLQARLRSLGIRWHYWLIPFVFGAAGVGAFLATRVEPESLSTLLTCGGLFCAISLLGFLWPFLRVRERQGARFASIRFEGGDVNGAFFPASRVKNYILLIGGSIFGLGGLAALIFADTTENRVKGGIAFVFYVGFVALSLRGSLGREQGFLLSEQGLLSQDTFYAFFIPWGNIEVVKIYSHQEQYNSTPSIGLQFQNIEMLELKKQTKNKMMENAKRFGWHLYYHAESLLLPLEIVEESITFYQQNPNARGELATGVALDRIASFENTTGSKTDDSPFQVSKKQ